MKFIHILVWSCSLFIPIAVGIHCVTTKIYLSILLLMNIWVFSHCRLLQWMLLQTFYTQLLVNNMCVFIEYIPRSRIYRAQGWHMCSVYWFPVFQNGCLPARYGSSSWSTSTLDIVCLFHFRHSVGCLVVSYDFKIAFPWLVKMLITFSWVYWTLVPCFKKIIWS